MMRMMADGARIAYRRLGDGPGTVLVHGGFIDSRSWTGLMEVLARTRTVVAADRRGHGDSDPYTSSYRLSDDVGDLVAIVTDLAADLGEVELVAGSAGCHVALAAAVAGAPAAQVVLWEPPDFQATPVSAELYDRLDRAAARGDRKLLVRLMINEVVGVNTGRRIPRPVFPLLFRSAFGRMVLSNALSIPAAMRAFEAWDWNAQDLSALGMPVTFLIGSQSPHSAGGSPTASPAGFRTPRSRSSTAAVTARPWSSRTASPRYSTSSAPEQHRQTAQARRDGA
jgi:pimeloyl-ACP methyl ester carboxylesterase